MADFKNILAWLYERAVREGRALTQEDYSRFCDLSRGTVNQILTGKEIASAKTIGSVFKAEKLPIDQLIELPAEMQGERSPYLRKAEVLIALSNEFGEYFRAEIEDKYARYGPKPRPVPTREQTGNLMKKEKKKSGTDQG